MSPRIRTGPETVLATHDPLPVPKQSVIMIQARGVLTMYETHLASEKGMT